MWKPVTKLVFALALTVASAFGIKCATATSMPVFTLVELSSSRHFYTMDCKQAIELTQSGKFLYQGISFYLVDPGPTPASPTPLYRYYNGKMYLYTSSPNGEGDHSYIRQLTMGYFSNTQRSGLSPLFGFFNPKNSDHLYTIDQNEIIKILSDGWKQEGGPLGFVNKSGWNYCDPAAPNRGSQDSGGSKYPAPGCMPNHCGNPPPDAAPGGIAFPLPGG